MRFKRVLCLMLSMICCFCAFALAEQEEKPSYVMAGFDDTQFRSWAENQFFIRMEEKTGVTFTYQQYKQADAWTQAKAEMTRDSELPDVLFKAALTADECIALRDRGVLIDLLPYLEAYAPHLWAILQENPEYLKAITLPNGSVAALPFISKLPVENYIWINTAWLKTLRLEEPATAEELVNVLTAFRDKDPNRNGRSDEIPLGFLGPFDLKFLGHAFGLIANDYNVYAKDGKVYFMPLDENYRLFVMWLRDLFQEGLLDENGFILGSSIRVVTDNDAAPTYGAVIAPVAADVFRTTWGQEEYSILMPLAYEGKQTYRDFTGPLLRGCFAVTSACQSPEEMLRWVDLLYTEEGAVLASVGKENVDYLIDGDGTWRMTDTASQSSDLYSAATLIDGGGTYPGIMAEDFQRRYGGSGRYAEIVARQDAFRQYLQMPFPYYDLTKEQSERIGPLQEKIGYYVDMQLARWVLGEEEISDASFAAFEEELNALGLSEFLAFWQEVLNQQ